MPGKKRKITKVQPVGWVDNLDAEIQRVADERFKGNFSMAANFLARLGVEAEKGEPIADILAGKTQVDMAALAAGAGA
jgi:hypothetical protein